MDFITLNIPGMVKISSSSYCPVTSVVLAVSINIPINFAVEEDTKNTYDLL